MCLPKVIFSGSPAGGAGFLPGFVVPPLGGVTSPPPKGGTTNSGAGRDFSTFWETGGALSGGAATRSITPGPNREKAPTTQHRTLVPTRAPTHQLPRSVDASWAGPPASGEAEIFCRN